LDRALHEWPHIPDSHLPEPWSCKWETLVETDDWYDDIGDESAVEGLVSQFGPILDGFVPAMYVPLGYARGDVVLCPPSEAGTYYLWFREGRFLDRNSTGLQQFSGSYSSVQHFVETADWNSLTQVPFARRQRRR
jgi:hypothetical protein